MNLLYGFVFADESDLYLDIKNIIPTPNIKTMIEMKIRITMVSFTIIGEGLGEGVLGTSLRQLYLVDSSVAHMVFSSFFSSGKILSLAKVTLV